MINDLDVIKAKIEELFKTNPRVHIDLNLKSERISLTNVSANIVSIYPNLFEISLNENGTTRKRIFQYVDLLTKNIVIKEFEI